MDADTERAVGEFLRGVQRRDPIPGLSVAVVDADEPPVADDPASAMESPGAGASGVPALDAPIHEPATYAAGFGARDLAGNRPATPDTLYAVGGVTQSVTAIAVLQLQSSGLLSLDDPVAEHVDVDLSCAAYDEPIRLRHLLSHSSGLPSLGIGDALIARRLRIGTNTLPLSDWDDVLAHVESGASERVAPPGERFADCEAGYLLLGRAVENCTGRPYAEYVREHVLDPLGLSRATFDDTEFAVDDDHMTQYLLDDGQPTAASLPTREVSHAAGGLLASVRHLAAYLRLHLNGGSYAGTQVVDADVLAEAHADQVETADGGYGYGWRRREVCDHDLLGHAGSIGVASAFAGFCPDAGVGVAVAANVSPDYSLAALGEGVFALAVDDDPRSVPFFARRRRFDRLTGRYASHRGVRRAEVRRDGDALRIDFDGALGDGGGPVGGDGGPLVPDPDGDPYDFYHLDERGERHPAEFRVDDGDGDGDGVSGERSDGAADGATGVGLLIGRWRLHRVDSVRSIR